MVKPHVSFIRIPTEERFGAEVTTLGVGEVRVHEAHVVL
jgi:hypothetical protein